MVIACYETVRDRVLLLVKTYQTRCTRLHLQGIIFTRGNPIVCLYNEGNRSFDGSMTSLPLLTVSDRNS